MLLITILCWGGITTSYTVMGLMAYDLFCKPDHFEILTKRE